MLRSGKKARIGDEIVCVIKKAKGSSSQMDSFDGPGKVKRGEVKRAIIVRTKKESRRPDGRVVRFDDNACVLINDKKEPIGNRILGETS